jgi:hypothetical protein
MIRMLFLPVLLLKHSQLVDFHRDKREFQVRDLFDDFLVEFGTDRFIAESMENSTFVHYALAMHLTPPNEFLPENRLS